MSLFDRPGFDALLQHVKSKVQADFHVGWAVCHPNGGYNLRHHHSERAYSAVYYVTVPNPAPATVFYEDGQECRVVPKEGQLLVFPGFVEHSVDENLSDGILVAVVCDFMAR